MRMGSFFEWFLKELAALTNSNITWVMLWQTLTCGESPLEETEALTETDERLIAVGLSFCIWLWQDLNALLSRGASDVLHIHGAEAAYPEFGRPLLDYVQAVDMQSYEKVKDMIWYEVNTSHDRRIRRDSRLENTIEFRKTEFYLSIWRFTLWRPRMSICVTKSGRLGWVPEVAVKGDVVAIVALDVPLALRPCSDGLYQLVGEAFVHGAMQGEIVKDMESFDRIDII